jgi:hypothetical protein
MAEPARRLANDADVEAVPPHLVAEIIHGALVTHPRPVAGHAGTFSVDHEVGAIPFEATPFPLRQLWHFEQSDDT